MRELIIKKQGIAVLAILILMGISPLMATWTVETVDDVAGVGHYTSIAVDSDARIHISYLDYYPECDLKYAMWDGSDWNIETVDTQGVVGWWSSIAVDADGNPAISCSKMNQAVRHARWDGSDWVLTTVDNVGEVGKHTSTALDSNGYTHICYFNGLGADLMYAGWDGSAWQIETVDSEGQVGLWSSMDLDESGNPQISYRDKTNGTLKYARWDGTAWQIETVAAAGNAFYTSICLDAAGFPHISYQDQQTNDLKCAVKTGSEWQIELVDADGNVGGYSSMAIGPDGYCHISYLDGANLAMKHASKLYDPPPTATITPTPTPADGTPTPPPCDNTGVTICMPQDMFYPGDMCACRATVCNLQGEILEGYPLFVILEVAGYLFFAPGFDGFDSYDLTFPEDQTFVMVLPEFDWPEGAGEMSEARWYGALTDPDITSILGEIGSFSFGWAEE